jgi:small subunit ribosomal protein S2
MAPYIYGVRNNIHIIDLAQTVPMLYRALQAVSDTVAGGGRVLFVGTKRQAAEPIVTAAKQAAQYYVNARWLGGMLTNWKTISRSIDRLKELDSKLDGGEVQGLTKKERLTLTREREKLENALGGIKDMGGLPDLIFVIDTNKEAIAIQEAQRLNVPVVAIIDTNCNPDGITYPVPGNDDAGRAVTLYCDLIARAAIDGISRAQGAAGIDIGAQEAPVEGALEGEGAGRGGRRKAAAPPTAAPEAAAARSSTGDDLKKITGIGPALEGKLHGLNITRYEQIANFTPEDVEKLDAELNLKGRIDRDDWIAQARTLMSEAAAA